MNFTRGVTAIGCFFGGTAPLGSQLESDSFLLESLQFRSQLLPEIGWRSVRAGQLLRGAD